VEYSLPTVVVIFIGMSDANYLINESRDSQLRGRVIYIHLLVLFVTTDVKRFSLSLLCIYMWCVRRISNSLWITQLHMSVWCTYIVIFSTRHNLIELITIVSVIY
jgi:hypothetical protein